MRLVTTLLALVLASTCNGMAIKCGGSREVAIIDSPGSVLNSSVECMGSYIVMWVPTTCDVSSLMICSGNGSIGAAVVVLAMHPNRTYTGTAGFVLLRNVTILGENISLVVNAAMVFPSMPSSTAPLLGLKQLQIERVAVASGATFVVRGESTAGQLVYNSNGFSLSSSNVSYDPIFGAPASAAGATFAVSSCTVTLDHLNVSDGGVVVLIGAFANQSAVVVRNSTFLATNVSYVSSLAVPFVTLNPMLNVAFDLVYAKLFVVTNLTLGEGSVLAFDGNVWTSDADRRMQSDNCFGLYVAGGTFLVRNHSRFLFQRSSVWATVPIQFTADIVLVDGSTFLVEGSYLNASFGTMRNMHLRSLTVLGASVLQISRCRFETAQNQGIYVSDKQRVSDRSSFLFTNNEMNNGAASFIFWNGVSAAEVLEISNGSRYLVHNCSFITHANVVRWNLPIVVTDSSVFSFSGNDLVGPGVGLWLHMGVKVARRSIFLCSMNTMNTTSSPVAANDGAVMQLENVSVVRISGNVLSSAMINRTLLVSLGSELNITSMSRVFVENNIIVVPLQALSLATGTICVGLQSTATVRVDGSSWVTLNQNRCGAANLSLNPSLSLWQGNFSNMSALVAPVGSVFCNSLGGDSSTLSGFAAAVGQGYLTSYSATLCSTGSWASPCIASSQCFVPLTLRLGGPAYGGSNASCWGQCHCSADGAGDRCFPRVAWELLAGLTVPPQQDAWSTTPTLSSNSASLSSEGTITTSTSWEPSSTKTLTSSSARLDELLSGSSSAPSSTSSSGTVTGSHSGSLATSKESLTIALTASFVLMLSATVDANASASIVVTATRTVLPPAPAAISRLETATVQTTQTIGSTSAAVSSVTGGDAASANVMVLLSTLSCATSGQSLDTLAISAAALSMFGRYGFLAMSLGNVGLIAVLVVVHWACTIVLHATGAAGEDDRLGDPYDTAEGLDGRTSLLLTRAAKALRFPSMSLYVVDLLLPPALFGGAAAVATSIGSGKTIAAGDLAGGLLSCMCVVLAACVKSVLLERYVLREHRTVDAAVTGATVWLSDVHVIEPGVFAAAAAVSRLPACDRALYPAVQWRPLRLRKTFGSLFVKFKSRGFARCVGPLELVVPLVTSVLSVVATTGHAACVVSSCLLTLVYFGAAVGGAVARPMRLPANNAAIVIQFGLFCATCVLKALSVADEIPDFLQLAQCGILIVKILLGLLLAYRDEEWSDVLNRQQREGIASCCEAIKCCSASLTSEECTSLPILLCGGDDNVPEPRNVDLTDNDNTENLAEVQVHDEMTASVEVLHAMATSRAYDQLMFVAQSFASESGWERSELRGARDEPEKYNELLQFYEKDEKRCIGEADAKTQYTQEDL